MEEILNILGHDDLSQEDCVAYLARNPDMDSDMSIPSVDAFKLQEAGAVLDGINIENTKVSREVLVNISAVLFANAVDGVSSNAKLVASKLLLKICSFPLSAAYGISTANVLSSICGIISKNVVDTLHGRRPRKEMKKIEPETQEDSENDDDMNMDEESAAMLQSQSQSNGEMPSKSSRNAVNIAPELGATLMTLHRLVSLYTTRHEDYVLESIAEALVTCICLGASRKAEYADIAPIAKAALVAFTCCNGKIEKCLMATYRAVLPVITLVGRDPKLPDSPKLKVYCQEAICEVMLVIIRSSGAVVDCTSELRKAASTPSLSTGKRSGKKVKTPSSSTTATPSSATVTSPATPYTTTSAMSEAEGVVDEGENETSPSSRSQGRKTPSKSTPQPQTPSEVTPQKPMATAFACAVGLIQRLLLTAQEKLIPRQTLISTAVHMIAALHCGIDDLSEADEYIAQNLKAFAKNKSTGTSKGKRKGRQVRSTRRKTHDDDDDDEDDEDDEENDDYEEECSAQKETQRNRSSVAQPVGGRSTKGTPGTPRNNTSKRQAKIFLEEQREIATARILSFLVNLSRSSKLNQRSLCLDIASSLLTADWVWERHNNVTSLSSHAEGEDDVHDKMLEEDVDRLIGMLVARCADVAATVRSRALGALWDLLDSVSSETSSKGVMGQLTARMHKLVMGEPLSCYSPTNQEGDAERKPLKSLLSTLRELVCDEKALVRVKAIQAVGLIFSMKWVQQEGSTIDREVPAHVFLSEDDILVIADRCSDQSVAVRKQAVVTLSSLLQSRISDSALQEAWIDTALPLVLDVESTIQMKVCQAVCDILISGTVASSGSIENEAVWTICCKIGDVGCTKLLKSAVSAMRRLGVFKSMSEKTTGVKMKAVLAAIKAACCVALKTDTTELMESQSEVQSLRVQDPEAVSRGAWILLEALVTEDISSILGDLTLSADFVVQCWLKKREHMTDGVALILDDLDTRMLRVLCRIPNGVTQAQKQVVCSKLQTILNSFQCDAQGISAAISVIFSFSVEASNSSGNDSERQGAKFSTDTNFQKMSVVAGALLNNIHTVLYSFIWPDHKAAPLFHDTHARMKMNLDTLSREGLASALFLLGEIALLGFSVEEDEDAYRTLVDTDSKVENGLPQFLLAESYGTFRINIPEILVVMTQILMGRSTPSCSDANATFASLLDKSTSGMNVTSSSSVIGAGDLNHSTSSDSKLIPHKVRAQAFVTMGKLCLRSRRRARDMVNVFLRELKATSSVDSSRDSLSERDMHSMTALTDGDFDVSGAHAVRSNALIVLGDLCVRFTNLVDRHVGAMAACLQDPDVLVRRHSFILLTQLLLQEYLKWRGMLLFRFLATTLDKDEEMAELAKYVLKNTLQSKYSGFIVQNFTEAIIVFNGCTQHATYQAMASIGSDGGSCAVSMDGIDLGGSSRRGHRMRVYEFMMEDITEEQKIQITANIVQDIFSYALDFPVTLQSRSGRNTPGGSAESMSALENAIVDAFCILQSPLLRVGTRKNAGRDDDDDVEEAVGAPGAPTEESARAAFQQAKTKVLKKLSVQHLVDHILPVVSSLKHSLEAVQSPVQRALMEYLVYLVHTNKNEVAQALSADPTLREEIEYDIKLFEREKMAEKKRRQIASAEKAVQKLEISTSRKSSARKHLGSTGKPRQSLEGFADRFVSQSSSTEPNASMGGEGGNRRVSRGTPQLRASSASIKKTITSHRQYVSGLATVQSEVERVGGDKKLSFFNGSADVTRSGGSAPGRSMGDAEDDFTSRLTASDCNMSPPKTTARRWSVTISDLDSSDNKLKDPADNLPPPQPRKRAQPQDKENAADSASSGQLSIKEEAASSPDKKKKRSSRTERQGNIKEEKANRSSLDSLSQASSNVQEKKTSTVVQQQAQSVETTRGGKRGGKRGQQGTDVLASLK